MLPHSEAQSIRRIKRLDCYCYIILLLLTLFVTGVAAGLLVGKLVLNEENGGQSSANWGGMVIQGGVQKPVLEAIVDMMNTENIKENLRYVVLCVFVYVHAPHVYFGDH